LVASAVAPSLNVTVPLGVPLPDPDALTVAVNTTACPYTDGFTDEATTVVLPDLFTTWLNPDDVLVLKLPSPPYTAVIVCVATLSPLVLKVAWPPLSVPVPKVIPPSLNVTVPPGVPLPGALALTVAVKVTPWPHTDGLAEELTLVVVLAGLTVWFNGAPVLSLPLKLLSPLYTAVTVWPATESEVMAPLVALPPLTLTGLPKAVPSIENWTVPVRVPAPGDTALTLAVKLTACPYTDGLADEATVVVVLAWLTVWVTTPDVLVRKLPSPLYTAVSRCDPAPSTVFV
jgi:hypothetical protein